MRVILVSDFGRDDLRYGESTLVEKTKDYVEVVIEHSILSSQLWHVAFVWPATEENIALYEAHKELRQDYEKLLDTDMYKTLNKMTRRIK